MPEESAKLAVFEQTIMPHLNAAYNLARWLTRSPGDAEDVVQEACLRAFRFFDGFHGGDGKTWLLAIVRNTCRTWLGRNGGIALKTVEFDERMHGTPAESESLDERLLGHSRVAALRKCVEALPAEYRGIIVMREMEELSYRDIAEAAGVPVGTVMSRLSRGRARLADCLGAR